MRLRTRGSKKALVAATASFLVFAGACGKKSDNEDDEDDAGGGGTPTGTVTQTGGDTPIPEAPDAMLALFQDSSDIAPSALASDTRDCLAIDQAASLADVVMPWPPALKSFLAAELTKFPEFDAVSGAIAGVFLAKPEALSDTGVSGGGGIVAGLMCASNVDDRGYIFMNYQLYVTDRMTTGALQAYQPMVAAVDPYVLSEHGDQAVYTLIHEIFHAIDEHDYLRSQASDKVAGRNAVIDLAWDQSGASIDPQADVYALTRPKRQYACSFHERGLGLAPTTPGDHEAAYRRIAEATTFISPYAQVNPFEDFADTLATWYFRATYDNGLVRKVYDDDLQVTLLANARLRYTFDTKQILRTSARHRAKMCAMVDLIFDEQDCEAQLDRAE